jgi:hypothetical protein
MRADIAIETTGCTGTGKLFLHTKQNMSTKTLMLNKNIFLDLKGNLDIIR